MIRISNLTFGFNMPILNGISLNIDNGEKIIGLLGQNGAGKTTLLNVLGRLYQKYSGTIEENYTVSFLPDLEYLPKDMTIEKCLKDFQYLYSTFNSNRALKMLEHLNLDINKKIASYSKGMKEQLHLVFTLAQDVDVYLLDEPLAAVDPVVRDVMIHLIGSYRKKDSIAIISTHLVQDMEQIFDEIIIMNNGRILLHESLSKLMENKHDKDFIEIYKEVLNNDNVNQALI